MSSARRRSRGAALAEAGIIMALLIPVTFAVVDFAGILYAFLALQNGVAQATRFAVTGNRLKDTSGATMSRDASIRQAMRMATPSLQIPDSGFAFYDLTTGAAGTGGATDVIRVTVTYNWQLLTPFLRPFFPSGSVTLAVASTMRNEPFPTS